MSLRKKIAIVGGGYSGTMCVAILKEEGLEPICFEKTDMPGGTWCYREKPVDGVSSTMPTVILNHSKEMGAFSNFPPRKEYNSYMRHHEIYRYFNDYWAQNDCLKHVRLNSEVTSVSKSGDYDRTGRWVVSVRNTKTGELSSDVYDGVMLCVGQFTYPKMPSFPGQEKFKGLVMHSHDLKEVSGFREQNVLVVGMGCSALDAAVDLTMFAKQVYLSTRSGAHVMFRIGANGIPYDYIRLKRCFALLQNIFSTNVFSYLTEKLLLDPVFHQKYYPVEPKYRLFQKDPVINDQLPIKLLSGSVIQKPNVSRFTESGVIFEGDNHVTEIDAVIMATGYSWKFPFLEEGVVVQEEGRINLYKCMYPPHLKHPTLVVIGFILPFGPGFSVAEMQSRWATQVFAGKCHLPSEKLMMEDIKTRHHKNAVRYAPSDKVTLKVYYPQYMDEIASQFGVKPNLFWLFFTDIRLFIRLWFGPFLPYQFRLQGPHKWESARKAIMESDERLLYSLQKDKKAQNSIIQRFNKMIKKYLFIFLFIFFCSSV